MIKLLVFGVGAAILTALSWSSLRRPVEHGFPRYFAFVSIWGLVVFNADVWFATPLTFRQILSWLLLATSILLALHGFYLLREIGRPEGRLENTSNLVRIGAYRYIRHPLYGSLILLAWGAFLKRPTLLPGVLLATAIGFLTATARAEEGENLRRFGSQYEAYIRQTGMFFPKLF